MNCKNKSFITKRKAFTLIELLIVIAIIGILFIVLVSKVDFATDKAKATGVQTDFRSFQVAFDTVAKENAGFNTFGWDTGDTNGDRVRNSYDAGDANKDGIKQDGEVWTGHKVYAENWTGVYTLVKPGTDFATVGYDKDVVFALESAINKNLDPKLHITIDAKTGAIAMANQAQDPWKVEYHGVYISNAEVDNKDRGAIIMYSNGANQEWGSEHSIANGVVTITVPGNNIYGKDDYSITSVYTYMNGYGEVKNMTTGFSNNQTMLGSSGNNLGGGAVVTPPTPINYEITEGANETFVKDATTLSFRSNADYDKFVEVKIDGNVVDPSNYTVTEGSTIVTFTKAFFDSLGDGNHTIEIVSDDGIAEAQFIIEKSIIPAENPNGTINSYSWSEIKYLAGLKLSSAEYQSKYGIVVGQKKDNKYYLVDLDGNEYNGFVFMYNSGIKASMNSTATNAGGYAASSLAVQVESLYDNLSDAELKAAIKSVDVLCNDGQTNSAALTYYTCHMFIASHRELNLSGYNGICHYNLIGNKFDGVDSTLRKTVSNSSLFSTRTAVSSNTTNFFGVKATGTEGDSLTAAGVYSVIPCFVIGGGSTTKTPITYTVCDGANATFAQDGTTASFTVNTTSHKFVSIKVDGVIIGSSNYTVSNDVATATPVSFNNATKITFSNGYINSLTAGTTYNIEFVFEDGIAYSTFKCVSKTINSYSWNEIETIANKKLTAEQYESQYGIVVGDSKVENGVEYILVDLGTDSTDYSGFVFMYKYTKDVAMKRSSSNAGGYSTATIITSTLPTAYNALSSDLRMVLNDQYIYYNDGNMSYQINANVFIPSATEVGYTNSFAFNDGYKFDYFVNDNSRKDLFGDERPYWLRTADANSNDSFYVVWSRGNVGTSPVSNQFDIVLCFVVGGKTVHGGGSN